MRDCVETSAERGALSTTSKELSEAELSTVAGGGSSGTGKVRHSDFVIVKVVDTASPIFF